MITYQDNLYHAQELQRQAYNKGVNPQSYAPSNKVWLNSKYIKIKRNCKLEAKFFGPFQFYHPVRKQAYKLELLREWKIHDVFHLLLLDPDTTKKKQVDEEFREIEFNVGDNGSKKYKVEAIRDSAVYIKESEGYLPGLYYLVSWKKYLKEEYTWEPASAIQQLRKLISMLHKNYLDKPIATFSAINTLPLMTRLTV